MTDHSEKEWNREEIADHLKSAMDTLTPDVFDRIDLTTPQDRYLARPGPAGIYRRMRTVALAAAACICVAVLGGGVAKFQNSRVESIVGIDVNPSIELSVNRNEKILKADPLNDDAVEIMDDMELEGVDLDIAVNAVIGSMVRHGYLDDLENAILVTVANDDKEKAAELRQNVVGDIELSLEEHKVSAIVYDQQASVTDEVKELAKKYGISYGKAYFLQELVEENDLEDEDMEKFAGMTMEEIATEIADRSYHVRRSDDGTGEESSGEKRTTEPSRTEAEVTTAPAQETTASAEETSGTAGSPNTSTTQAPTAAQPSQTQPSTGEDGESEPAAGGSKARIDNVDYEDGYLNVVFKEKVKWKNPTISVTGEGGSYSAKISDTGSDSCEIEIRGLEGGQSYTFVLGGVAPREGGSYSSVKGYFDTPDIADGAIGDNEGDEEDGDEEDEKPEDDETPASTAAPESAAETPGTVSSEPSPPETVPPSVTADPGQTEGDTGVQGASAPA